MSERVSRVSKACRVGRIGRVCKMFRAGVYTSPVGPTYSMVSVRLSPTSAGACVGSCSSIENSPNSV
jgi:hypothetical protein